MPLSRHISLTVNPPCDARSRMKAQIASRPLRRAARLRIKNPAPASVAQLYARVRLYAAVLPAVPRGPLPAVGLLSAQALLRLTPVSGLSRRRSACAECRVLPPEL